MNCRLAAAGNVRPKGKCYSMAGSLFFMSSLLLLLLLLPMTMIAQAAARPADEEGDETLSDTDNIEYHHVKIIDGIMHEDHPIVMYKEDFVSEDFDPGKSKTQQKYKNLMRHQRPNETEQYNVLKPEKLYFDVLPQAPILVEDDVAADSKFDASQIRAELVPLVADDVQQQVATEQQQSKSILSKHPKKFHSRQRRSLVEQTDQDEHKLQKRNPFYRTHAGYDYQVPLQNNFVRQAEVPQYYPVRHPAAPTFYFVRHPVQGKRPSQQQPANQPDIIGSRGDFVIWGSRPNDRPPTTSTARPVPGLWHDSNPANFDFSLFDATPPPLTERPNTIDLRPPANRRPANPAAARPTNARPTQAKSPISNCVWAIVNCCSSEDSQVRYNCFEEFGCSGAFWGLNPCADNVRDNAIRYVDNLYPL